MTEGGKLPLTKQTKGEITRILAELRGTDRKTAMGRLLPLVYAELRAVAGAHLRHERPDHTLQATALVHEAYVRMLGGHDPPWNDRGPVESVVLEKFLIFSGDDGFNKVRGNTLHGNPIMYHP